MSVTVRTQSELDAALAAHQSVIYIESPAGVWLELRDSGSSRVMASGSSHVVARGSSHVVAGGASHVEAWGSSHVVAWGSSHVVAWGASHVVAWESSHVVAWGASHVMAWGASHVEARGSSHVEARESSHVVAWESSHVEATAYVAVHLYSRRVTLTGNGHAIDLPAIDETDLATWIDYHGATTSGDDVVLYKALDADLRAEHNDFQYPGPGGEVEAPDWTDDHGCGGGLHLGPTVHHATDYRWDATRWLRCLVAREDIRTIPGGTAKVKARRVRVVAEVDAFGRDLAGAPC